MATLSASSQPRRPGRAKRGCVLVGANCVEREVLEGSAADTGPVREAAVLAVRVLDLLSGAGEAIPVDLAVDDSRDPPPGDRVLAKLEQPRRHASGGAEAGERRTDRGGEACGEDPGRALNGVVAVRHSAEPELAG